MRNQTHVDNNHIDYDCETSGCGLPIYFVTCGDDGVWDVANTSSRDRRTVITFLLVYRKQTPRNRIKIMYYVLLV